ncbi:MAG: type II toxin-antitoxin system RelE/ParE family toxin [Rickettsiaceae bacterium]|nr:type II toxin-antitoxin system RelE/ParE family toxin [Rickettsiaceae bacterium]
MKWKITYFCEDTQKLLLKWPKGLLAKYLRILDLMADNGANLGLPFTKAMGAGLFEIRVKASEGIGRIFYCTVINKEIVILHCFIKKTQKTPTKELNLAKQRMLEVKNE